MKKFTINVFSCASRLLNVCAGGSPDLTFSARVYRDRWSWAVTAIDWLFEIAFKEADHCRKWWEWEVLRSRHTVARADAMEDAS